MKHPKFIRWWHEHIHVETRPQVGRSAPPAAEKCAGMGSLCRARESNCNRRRGSCRAAGGLVARQPSQDYPFRGFVAASPTAQALGD